MLPLNIYDTEDIEEQIAKQARQLRLAKNVTRKTLAEHSGVSLGSIQRFEQTGKISLENLLKIAQALDALQDFHTLFQLPEPKTIADIQQQENLPKRGRL
jgi:transcriptional regulator with XRE-family HTH domain